MFIIAVLSIFCYRTCTCFYYCSPNEGDALIEYPIAGDKPILITNEKQHQTSKYMLCFQ